MRTVRSRSARRPAATFVLILLAVALATASLRPAPAEADHVGGGGFEGSHYAVITDHLTWHDANDYCGDLADGGHLVTIGSAAENAYVYDLIRELAPDLAHQWWLGATDEVEEGTWVWVTGEAFEYTNWGPGEPNNAHPDDPALGEDYLTFHGEAAYDPPLPGVWNDWPTAGADGSPWTAPFVCEFAPGAGMSVIVGPDFTTLAVNGWNFTPGSTVTMQINPRSDGSADYQQTATNMVDWVSFDAIGSFTVADGDLVRLTDDSQPATVRETVAQYMTLTILDPDNDIIAGTANPGTTILVTAGTVDVYQLTTQAVADADHQWSVDLGELGFDLQRGQHGWLEIADADNDYTWMNWEVAAPSDRLDDLEAQVEQLEMQPPAASKSLLSKVDSAQKSYAKGNLAAACSQLNDFIAQVEDFEAAGKLSANEATTLRLAAVWSKVEMGC